MTFYRRYSTVSVINNNLGAMLIYSKTRRTSDHWDLFLRGQFTNLTGWYRRHGLQTVITNFRYEGDAQEWRQFFNYWGRRIGDHIQRNDSWNRFLYSVIHGLTSREKTKIKVRQNSQAFKAWADSLKVARALIAVEKSRLKMTWNKRISYSWSYLNLFERKLVKS